ncbi:Bicaudal D-related protein 1 [Operophtera brumata]|uniref:Bicaudal D-related protein 1 n=1 Tax=Operophtera brumata TaxID=104452 RepID=A0A0L7L8S1_OPEBR|nr:Bicaudal D-related protein 1 [Operophtera brumata]
MKWGSEGLSVAEVELNAAAEERDKLLNDANYSSLQNDEAVTRARQERDEAIDRKKAAEERDEVIDRKKAAEVYIHTLHTHAIIYSSLQNDEAVMGARQERDEVIDRKKAAEMDMQELIDEQMKHKLTSEKRRKLPAPPPAPTRASRLLGFFHR